MTSASLTLYLYRVIFSGPGRGSGVRIAVTCVSAHLRLQHRCVWWRLPGQLLFHHLSSTLPAVAFDGIHDSGQLFGPGFADSIPTTACPVGESGPVGLPLLFEQH